MNNEAAQFILRAFRPSGRDAAGAFFAEALAQSRRDPELQKWLSEEQAFDLVVTAKLQAAISVPPGLKASLLALKGSSMTATVEPRYSDKDGAMCRPRRSRPNRF